MKATAKPDIRNITVAELARMGGGHVAYVRPIRPEMASKVLNQTVEVPEGIELYGLFMADGTPIMITDSRESAVANAFEHDLMTMSVH